MKVFWKLQKCCFVRKDCLLEENFSEGLRKALLWHPDMFLQKRFYRKGNELSVSEVLKEAKFRTEALKQNSYLEDISIVSTLLSNGTLSDAFQRNVSSALTFYSED